MDFSVLNDISYGMYVVTTKYNNKNVGCFVNTVTQITSKNPIVSISINKENYTNEAIKNTKKFIISILSENTDQKVIGKFGFFSSRNTNKFENIKYEDEELPIIKENICGYLVCELINVVSVETHDIFIARVLDTKKENDFVPMTYSYYHKVIKGGAPKTAPTYIENKESIKEVEGKKYKCSLCGYVYDDAKEKMKFEDLPDEWVCPLCGAGKELFKQI